MPDDFSTTYAHAIAAATTLVGYIVAFVPSFAVYQQVLIAGTATLLSVGVLLAHALRNQGKKISVPPPTPPKQ